MSQWGRWVGTLKENLASPKVSVTIAICGKYTALEDSYASIVEALVHCEAHLNTKVNIKWIETSDMENDVSFIENALEGVHGVIVPGGFGYRGIEGKINIITYVRENNIPYLGICYGMQLAVVEYARNKCGIPDAHTTEVEESGKIVKDPVVTILPDQIKVDKKGGTMRLGGHDVELKAGSHAFRIFGNKKSIRQRFRHRYEVNPDYVETLEAGGLVFSGKARKENIMQVMELPDHVYFISCQFHPELTSSLREPSPLFHELVKCALTLAYSKN